MKTTELTMSDISEGLDNAFISSNSISVEDDLSTAKIVIFSDHHRGVGDGADDFKMCSKVYSAALGYYLELGYSLIILGDTEELWECRPEPVIKKYKNTLMLESEFMKKTQEDPGHKKYYRVYGNHDDIWKDAKEINNLFKKHIPEHPEIAVAESLRLSLKGPGNKLYRFFLVHGNQGTWDSDKFGSVSRVAVRYIWRPLQQIFKFRSTTPAKDEQLRGQHDMAMYNWAKRNWNGSDEEKKVVLIAGHTHQPVFSAQSYVSKLKNELAILREKLADNSLSVSQRYNLEKMIAEKRAEFEYAKAEHGDSDGGDVPCYFNTGCCSFSDGDITGIEITDGMIKLVRWPGDDGGLSAKVLEAADITQIFAQLSCSNQGK